MEYILLSPPHYSLPSEDDIFLHHQYVNDAADIGIVLYNSMWAMPQPGYSFSRRLLERLMELENVIGVKWSSFNQDFYLKMARLFADKLNFVCNQMTRVLSLPAKLGFKGFINSDGLVAPRFVLHEWDLFKNGRFDELDNLILKTYVDPFLRLAVPEDIVWASMGEGPHVRVGMEALGMSMGPAFPAQQALSADTVRQRREGFEKSGLLDWVDWKEELWENHAKAGSTYAAA